MEKLTFFKYQGTGNDFIIFDNRDGTVPAISAARIKAMCDRRFGIGADGLMLLNTKPGYDFEMTYYNSDGRESSMCGNGGRCLVRFARDIGMHKISFHFLACDGQHEAEIDDDIISLKMMNVPEIKEYHGDSILDTGSPHYVKIVGDVMDYDVYHKGMDIRYNPQFEKEGINVNFVEQKNDHEIIVRTYERGVEDETLSCGTGVTAAALVCYHNECGYNEVTVITKGGKLTVRYDCPGDGSFENVWLCGPAVRVFEGTV